MTFAAQPGSLTVAIASLSALIACAPSAAEPLADTIEELVQVRIQDAWQAPLLGATVIVESAGEREARVTTPEGVAGAFSVPMGEPIKVSVAEQVTATGISLGSVDWIPAANADRSFSTGASYSAVIGLSTTQLEPLEFDDSQAPDARQGDVLFRSAGRLLWELRVLKGAEARFRGHCGALVDHDEVRAALEYHGIPVHPDYVGGFVLRTEEASFPSAGVALAARLEGLAGSRAPLAIDLIEIHASAETFDGATLRARSFDVRENAGYSLGFADLSGAPHCGTSLLLFRSSCIGPNLASTVEYVSKAPVLRGFGKSYDEVSVASDVVPNFHDGCACPAPAEFLVSPTRAPVSEATECVPTNKGDVQFGQYHVKANCYCSGNGSSIRLRVRSCFQLKGSSRVVKAERLGATNALERNELSLSYADIPSENSGKCLSVWLKACAEQQLCSQKKGTWDASWVEGDDGYRAVIEAWTPCSEPGDEFVLEYGVERTLTTTQCFF